MDELHTNPFASYAQIVDSDGFVGRTDEINAITDRIIRATSPGCVAIVGPPRIGKSSLAFHTLRRPARDLLEQRLLVAWCNFATIPSLDHLLRDFVRLLHESLEDHGQLSDVLARASGRVMQCDNWFDLQHSVQRFFKLLKLEHWRTVIVLEEFDAARQVFKENPLGFQTLRALADNPDWRVAFVTCSRRSIPEIELLSRTDISNFHNIFHYLFLRPFAPPDQQDLLARLEQIGLTLMPDDVIAIDAVAGGHPFLISVIGFHIAQSWLYRGQFSVEEVVDHAQETLIDYFDDLTRLLAADNSLDKLLQILFGPMIDATSEDATRLVRYGLLIQQVDGSYRPFSRHFGEYLRLTERTVEFWPLWKDTERSLRMVIAQVMQKAYPSDNWTTDLERARPKLKAMLDDCRSRQADEKRKFGSRASVNLLDYTYPGDLYQIIRTHWASFQPTLKHNEQYWEQRFDLLARIRNPVAHNRDEVLALHERQIAEGYCREILHRLSDDSVDK